MERPPACMQALNAPTYDGFYMEEPFDPWDTPLSMLIRCDDVDALAEYLSMHPYRLKGPGVVQDNGGTVFPDAFEYAATWGATKVLRSLLDHESRHPQQDFRFGAKEYGLLNFACQYGQLETVRYLLDASHDMAGDLRFRDGNGWTPLLAAADALADQSKYEKYHSRLDVASYTGRCEEIITLLLDKGAPADDVRERQFEHRENRFMAVNFRIRWCEGYTEEEIAEGPEWDTTPRGEVITCVTDTVLSLAIRRASAITIQRLLNGGADAHLQLTPVIGEIHLTTSLHIAARYFNAAAIDVICEGIGNTEFKKMMKTQDSWGNTVLNVAITQRRFMLPADQIVLQGVATFSTLLRSCDVTDVNARATTKNMTLLQSVILFDFKISHRPTRQALRARVAKLLVEHGANPAAKMANGWNALHALASSFHITADDQCAEAELIELFLSHGVLINDADNSGETALHIAIGTHPKPVAVRTLLRHGAMLDTPNEAGDTQLHVAAAMTISMIDRGLEYQQAVEMQDEVMQLIMEAAGSYGGSPMERRNALGKTPLEIRDESRERVKEALTARILSRASRGLFRGRGRGR